jgi:hypothetical protein
MHVGYVDEDDRFFCLECWKPEARAGHRPARLLDDEPAPEDNFWIVDDCTSCQRHIKYTDVRLLA